MTANHHIACAKMTDFPSIYNFYRDVCAAQNETYCTCWNITIYPHEEDLKKHIEQQEMYLYHQGAELVAAMVLTDHETEEYRNATWKVQAADHEVYFLQLLAVHPKFRGKHFSDQMMQFMIEAAHRNNKKALRLAVVKGNLPAERLYQKTGFRYIAEYTIHYELTGKVVFYLYEMDLTNGKEYPNGTA